MRYGGWWEIEKEPVSETTPLKKPTLTATDEQIDRYFARTRKPVIHKVYEVEGFKGKGYPKI